MYDIESNINNYLQFCQVQKCLSEKTIRAYTIDLSQFSENFRYFFLKNITFKQLESYIINLHRIYKPKTVKRKIASMKAFFHYCEYQELIVNNPFNKIQTWFREPTLLPKTIPLHTIRIFLKTIYAQISNADTPYKRRNALRDVAVVELLFSTGMRISELCGLLPFNINFEDNTVLIYGKGAKERILQLGNDSVIKILLKYKKTFSHEIQDSNHFFVNQSGTPLSDQTVRRMLNRYRILAGIEQHITPHMFRHTFASSLLDADVDIRYIQEMLGHSSINTTQIYTHVTLAKQKDILTTKHPRNTLDVATSN